MKVLFAALALMSLQSVPAAEKFQLKPTDLSVSAASAKILSVEKICPQRPGQMSCRAIGSKVIVEVALKGCLDRLGATAHFFHQENGINVLSFGALNVHTEASTRAFCIKQPKTTVTLTTSQEGEFKLETLDLTPENFEIEKGDRAVEAAAARVASTKPICPTIPGRPTCAGYGMKAKIVVGLNRCADRLGALTYKFVRIGERAVLKLLALNVYNESSDRVRCAARPEEVVEIFLPHMGAFDVETLELEEKN
jgi:hypothetical protein